MIDPGQSLVFLDIETTALDEYAGQVLELGLLIANPESLEPIAQRSWVIYHNDLILARQSPWSLEQHAKSGLTEECRRERRNLFAYDVGLEARTWLIHTLRDPDGHPDQAGKYPMVGKSVHFDRRWLRHHMPELEAWFYHGNTDISSIGRFLGLVKPDYMPWVDKEVHRVDADNLDALAELRYMVETCRQERQPQPAAMVDH